MDMSAFVVSKSDQLNADDLLAGPITIRISRVSATGNADQPIAVHFEGDNSKPFKPCKSMRRVMVAAWGRDASQYVGRAMTIYRDPKVVFGGLEVGGIRVSHMSHIEKRLDLALMATKGKRAPYRVEPLKQEGPDIEAGVRALVAQIGEAGSLPALEALTASDAVTKRRTWLAKNRADLAQQVDAAVAARLEALSADDFPGVVTPREEVAP
jgi:hypothetical protein